MELKTPIVSILIPTRNRVNKLKKCLNNLFKTCYDKHNFEVLCGVDNDDCETIDFLDKYIINHPNVKYFLFEKGGYKNIYKISNYLALQSSGHFLFTYADDSEIISYNWDLVLKEHNNKIITLNPLIKNFEHYVRPSDSPIPGYVWFIYPIIPKKLVDIIGRISNNTASDSWISEIIYQTQIPNIQEDNIIIKHSRFDETKNEKHIDSLYYKTKNEVNFVNADFFSEYQVHERIKDIEKIKSYIKSFEQEEKNTLNS
jgi:glycosyltransferase involved in cell wall biosynthesis